MRVLEFMWRPIARRWEELGWEGKTPSPNRKAQGRSRYLINH